MYSLSWWCHPTISSSVMPFSSCLQSFPASGSFPVSQFFASGGQRIGVSASASVLTINNSGLISFRTDWMDLLAVQGTLKSLLQHHSPKASSLQCSAFFIVQLSHPYMTNRKTTAFTRQTFVGKVMSLLFNMLSRLAIAFLPRSKCINFMAVVISCSETVNDLMTDRFGLAFKMPEFIRPTVFSVLILADQHGLVLILTTECVSHIQERPPSLALSGEQELASEGPPWVEGSGRGSYSENPCIREMKKP